MPDQQKTWPLSSSVNEKLDQFGRRWFLKHNFIFFYSFKQHQATKLLISQRK